MKDGLYLAIVHGHKQFYKIIGGEPHLLGKEKGKLAWCPTVVEESRLKKARPISELELVNMITESN